MLAARCDREHHAGLSRVDSYKGPTETTKPEEDSAKSLTVKSPGDESALRKLNTERAQDGEESPHDQHGAVPKRRSHADVGN